MSNLTIASSSPNSVSARARASSVSPTPVGPRNRNEPTRPVRVAEDAQFPGPRGRRPLTASSCPTTRSCICSFEPEQALALFLGQLGDWDARAARHHLGDVVGEHLRRALAAAREALFKLGMQLVDARLQDVRPLVVLGRDGLVPLALVPRQLVLHRPGDRARLGLRPQV